MIIYLTALTNLLLLKLSNQKKQILLWESFTESMSHLQNPSMDLSNFNDSYLKKLLENIFKEQKSIFLLGDFNVDLVNYNEHHYYNNQKHGFLGSLAFNSFIPLILQPTRITSHSNTLIDNAFSNVIDPDIISGNFTATIPDHLPQFAIRSTLKR